MAKQSRNPVEFTTPPGRFVFGDVYDPETEDFDGNPMVYKSGVDTGQPRVDFVVGVAIPKTQAHWGLEIGWGDKILAKGRASFPGGDAENNDFSWKISDGDSRILPKKSKSKVLPCDREGWKGCWILRFSGGFAPKLWNAIIDPKNPTPLIEPGVLLTGYWIQVIGEVDGNSGASPGVYLNHRAVGLLGYDKVIQSQGVDVVGKFGGALPSGVSQTPVGGFQAPPPLPGAPDPRLGAIAAGNGMPPLPGAPAASALPPPVHTAVTRDPGFIAPPAPGALPGVGAAVPPPPGAAVPPPPSVGPVMTPAAGSLTYAQFIAGGWTADQLRAKGYLV